MSRTGMATDLPGYWPVDMRPTAHPLVLDGRYRLGDLLGRGGMGEVRAAEDLRLGRSVAVKLLRADLASDADLRRRFEAEARAAARISHPNAVAVYDAGEHEGVAYLVMERLPGHTLADEVAAGPIGQERACAVAGQVLAALGEAHDRGLIHRDIKPGNVLLTADGVAKLADFGIAKVVERSIEKSDDATTGLLLGTPAYLAPERLAGKPATPASDLYAVGVVLYEALTGRKPFDGDTPFAVVHAVHQARPESLRVLRPDVDPAVTAAIEQAMHPDPGERFQTASALAGALSGDDPDVETAPSGVDRPVVESAEVTAALPRGGTIRLDEPVSPAPLPSARRLSQRLVIGAAAIVLLAVVLVATWQDGDPKPPQPVPTTTTAATAGPGSLTEQLDRALQELEEAVKP